MKLGPVVAVCLLAAACGGGGGPNGNQPFCGDGVVNASLGEQCEMDSDCGSGMRCTASCSCVMQTCGDGILDPNEECDDGMANGTAGDPCSSSCKLEPEVTVHWKITAAKLHQADADQTGSCPWWPSGSSAPTSSIRLLSQSLTLATFDCDPNQSEGAATVRLPVGSYTFELQPVQASDEFAPASLATPVNVQGPSDVMFAAQQGGYIQLEVTTVSTATCSSLAVEVQTNQDQFGTPRDLQQVPVDDMVEVQPCQTMILLGPYPTTGPSDAGATGPEYTVTVTENDMAGSQLAVGSGAATIPQSNLQHPASQATVIITLVSN